MSIPFLGLRHSRWLTLLLWGASTWAQNSPWPLANQDVARNPRGHVDILRWELSQPTPTPSMAAPTASTWTLDAALQVALAQRPDLLVPPGLGAVDRTNQRLQSQALQAQVQRAWYQAIAAAQSITLLQDNLDAAAAANDLAQRMVQVGNWSEARGLQAALGLYDAQAQLAQAQMAVTATRSALWQLAGTPGSHFKDMPDTPRELPPLPDTFRHPSAADAVALVTQAQSNHPDWARTQQAANRAMQGLSASHQNLARQGAAHAWATGHPQVGTEWTHPVAEAARAWSDAQALDRLIESSVWLALTRWQRNSQLAGLQQTQLLPLRERQQAETQLRYNGMLASAWDLLGAAQSRLQASLQAVSAQRDAWMAWVDLQAVLQGQPYVDFNAGTGNAGNASPSTAAGH